MMTPDEALDHLRKLVMASGRVTGGEPFADVCRDLCVDPEAVMAIMAVDSGQVRMFSLRDAAEAVSRNEYGRGR